MYDWEMASKVFFYGFSGVFACLAILMFSIQICGAILKNFKKKS